MLLVSLEQRLSTGHILRQLIGGDHRLGVVHPADEVAVVAEEAVQVVAVVEQLAPLRRLVSQLLPLALDLLLLGANLVRLRRVRLAQALRLAAQLLYLSMRTKPRQQTALDLQCFF